MGGTGATEEKWSTNCKRPFWGRKTAKVTIFWVKKRSHLHIFRQWVTMGHELSRIPPYTLLSLPNLSHSLWMIASPPTGQNWGKKTQRKKTLGQNQWLLALFIFKSLQHSQSLAQTKLSPRAKEFPKVLVATLLAYLWKLAKIELGKMGV